VLLVDDHPMVRRGLRSLLLSYEDIEVVGEAGEGVEGLHLANELSPDIILLDIKLPGPSGLDIIDQLRRGAPMAKIMILTAHDNEEYVLRALRHGVHAYLLKSASDDTLVDSIRQVYTGAHLLSPTLVGAVILEFQTLAKCHARHEVDVSEQELEVLVLLAEGATNAEISEKTYLSERTVKRKVQEILDKLGARNRTQAVVEAINKGLISIE
jgi:DNA-binding NarL/FixJ family response regulator